jgi:hypothetical protein
MEDVKGCCTFHKAVDPNQLLGCTCEIVEVIKPNPVVALVRFFFFFGTRRINLK